MHLPKRPLCTIAPITSLNAIVVIISFAFLSSSLIASPLAPWYEDMACGIPGAALGWLITDLIINLSWASASIAQHLENEWQDRD